MSISPIERAACPGHVGMPTSVRSVARRDCLNCVWWREAISARCAAIIAPRTAGMMNTCAMNMRDSNSGAPGYGAPQMQCDHGDEDVRRPMVRLADQQPGLHVEREVDDGLVGLAHRRSVERRV